MLNNLLITGGCGFVGSHFINFLFAHHLVNKVVNVDKLTYAADSDRLKNLYNKNYIFIKADINNIKLISKLLIKYNIDTVVHFAAESHVDNSIKNPANFIKSNVNGTFSLLEAVRLSSSKIRFHYINTDEVFGSAKAGQSFSEAAAYRPSSPYSASKAAAAHLVMAYRTTYGLAVTMSNSCNIFGEGQHNEKLIPKTIGCFLTAKAVPIYGDGQQRRTWLYADQHSRALWHILKYGELGQSYNLTSGYEMTNLHLIKLVAKLLAQQTRQSETGYLNLITYIIDRLGHDSRYIITGDKLKQLNFSFNGNFEEELTKTIKSYL
ncbi:MAG: GDP-mannose 4,6-dehydratase [Spirochaetaceae bacterium]|nr:GDP-mannose 4,6-dehydratase [Spirochaetaceae bacterium]